MTGERSLPVPTWRLVVAAVVGQAAFAAWAVFLLGFLVGFLIAG